MYGRPHFSLWTDGITSGTGETIILDNAIPAGNRIFERYKLARTSYALEVDDNDNLILHYNFAPTFGAGIAGNSQLLLRNVSNFRFQTVEGAIRIKICMEEQIGSSATARVRACKEKVVF